MQEEEGGPRVEGGKETKKEKGGEGEFKKREEERKEKGDR